MPNELAKRLDIMLTVLNVKEGERARCPFYGFSGIPGILMDTEGNQCALVSDSYSPCYMEFQGQKPNWDECRYHTDKLIQSLKASANSIRVFPEEFMPKDTPSWEGISFSEWYQHVMGRSL